ncbi:MAG: c-type cytochrome [Mycobacterium sp.]|nr:c-type cytochrome [Mycobacterium sp.]
MLAGGLARTGRRLSIAAALTVTIVGGWAAALLAPSPPMHIADANDVETVMRGKQIYSGHCASCHGRYLQGQALWQLVDDYAGRRAPAHDETGHTWQHPDEDLFEMTKYGRFTTAPPGYRPGMPAFAHDLADPDILAVLAYIKARWPLGLRVAQALLNPSLAGLPPGAEKVDWKFPPTCKSLLRQSDPSREWSTLNYPSTLNALSIGPISTPVEAAAFIP